MLHTIVEGEPGIFPDPVARVMRKVGGWFGHRRPDAPHDPGPTGGPGDPDDRHEGAPTDRPGGPDDSDEGAPPTDRPSDQPSDRSDPSAGGAG